jgi:purine-nucleoside phosphorylase
MRRVDAVVTTAVGAYERAQAAADAIVARSGTAPDTAVVLGSGLSGFADRVSDALVVPYADLPNWPLSKVTGHPGRLVVGRIAGRRVAVLAGRAHLYEGNPPEAVVFAVRVMGRLGVRQLVLTNAAGAINVGFSPGSLMIVDDHINLTGVNPLTGDNDERFGPRFPDMSEVYSGRLRQAAHDAAAAAGIAVVHGVYAGCAGPNYETPAEVRYLRAIGADAAGMSTVPEAIAARHMGIEVLGISCLTNMAAGIQQEPLSHAEVLATAQRVGEAFETLVEGTIGRF